MQSRAVGTPAVPRRLRLSRRISMSSTWRYLKNHQSVSVALQLVSHCLVSNDETSTSKMPEAVFASESVTVLVIFAPLPDAESSSTRSAVGPNMSPDPFEEKWTAASRSDVYAAVGFQLPHAATSCCGTARRIPWWDSTHENQPWWGANDVSLLSTSGSAGDRSEQCRQRLSR